MPSIDLTQGTYTLQQLFNFTSQSKFKTRFRNAKRDRVKFVTVKKIHFYSKKRPTLPELRYEIISKSTPQYKPYAPSKDKRGRWRKSQNSIVHEYETIFIFGDEGITLNTTKWAMRVGSMKKWPDKIPQNKVAQIHKDTRERLIRKYGKNTTKYKEEIQKIKKRAKYISDGDYVAQELGINGDFIFRLAYPLWRLGHLYSRNYYGNVPAVKTNPKNIPFLPKHAIVILTELMKQGVLTQ